jgi:predicted lipid-binding transport protein (Tim44 family)
MTVQKFSGTPPSSTAVVSGTVQNMGEQTIEVVSLVVVFYDKNGKMIDKSSAITSFLEPGSVWNFSIKSEGTESWKIVDYSISSSSTP